MTSGRVVEISVESVERGVAAERGGASRIELCGSLEIGGVTPSSELMRETRARVSVPIFSMVRPRGGDFVYSTAEFEAMKRAIEVARAERMNGVVLGLLRGDGRVDVERTAELVRVAGDFPVTFHRAFDEAADLVGALEDVISTGAARLLTSGGAATAPEAVVGIAELVRKAGGKIVVMPGSGVTAGNIAEVARGTGATEFHAGLSSVMGRDAGATEFEAEVRKLLEALGEVD